MTKTFEAPYQAAFDVIESNAGTMFLRVIDKHEGTTLVISDLERLAPADFVATINAVADGNINDIDLTGNNVYIGDEAAEIDSELDTAPRGGFEVICEGVVGGGITDVYHRRMGAAGSMAFGVNDRND